MPGIDEKKVALSLYWNLHSSAEENFISSLLTSAINENDKFRKYIINKAGVRRSEKHYVANANEALPNCLCVNNGNSKTYKRPDIEIYNKKESKLWDKLYECKSIEEIEDIPSAIFIETKFDFISQVDAEKYCKFIDVISVSKSFKFLIITSLFKGEVDNILDTTSNNTKKTNYLKRVFENRLVVVVSYQEICEKLEAFANDKNKYPTSVLAKEYIGLYVNKTGVYFWQKIINNAQGEEEVYNDLRYQIVHAVLNEVGMRKNKTINGIKINSKTNHLVIKQGKCTCLNDLKYRDVFVVTYEKEFPVKFNLKKTTPKVIERKINQLYEYIRE